MSTGRHLQLLHRLRRTAVLEAAGDLTDGQLLGMYVSRRNEAAFETLIRRHGPMVLGVCRRLLPNEHDAEDAFQATFLVLVRKASSVQPPDKVGSWLHGVAYHAALKARALARRRQARERQVSTMPEPATVPESLWNDLLPLLDHELSRIPDKFRLPVILCDLEGKTRSEAARQLGWPEGTVAGRLAQGRAQLAKRLTARGLPVSAGVVTWLLSESMTQAGLLEPLIQATLGAATKLAAGGGLVVGSTASVAAITEGVLKAMLLAKLRIATVVVLTLTLIAGGVVARQAITGLPQKAAPANEAKPMIPLSRQPRPDGKAAARVDGFGDPLPPGALARMGTARFFHGGDSLLPSTALALSPDGKILAAHVDFTTVCLWEASTGKEIRRLTRDAGKGNVAGLSFTPDSKLLVTLDWDQTACWWDVATGRLLRTVEPRWPKRTNPVHPGGGGGMAASPCGRVLGLTQFLKSRADGRQLALWDPATGAKIHTLSRPSGKITSLPSASAFSPDGKLLATVMVGESVVDIWDVATGAHARQLTLGEGSVTALAFSPDSKLLARRGHESLCLWDIASATLIRQVKASSAAGQSPLAFSPDGRSVLEGKEGHLWDLGTGLEIRTFGFREARVALFAPDGRTVFVGGETGAIRAWTVATGKEIGPRQGYQARIWAIAYAPDGKTLASLGEDETLRLWDTATGKQIRQLAKHETPITSSLAYSPDGRMLVSTGKVIHVWDPVTGQEIRQLQPAGILRYVTFSPDGTLLAASMDGVGGRVRLWKAATGEELHTFTTGSRNHLRKWQIAFSRDSRVLATPGDNNTVSLWDVATRQIIGRLSGPAPADPNDDRTYVAFLAFSPDGRVLATSTRQDEKICLWEIATGKQFHQLEGFKGNWEGYPLAFSPDGRILATAAQGRSGRSGQSDRCVHLWDAGTFKEIGQLKGHQHVIRAIAFSRDGKTLASGSDDLTCLVWDVRAFAAKTKTQPGVPHESGAASDDILESAWTDLASPDPVKGYEAISLLRAVPEQAIPMLRERVRHVEPPADHGALARWIRDLDSGQFTVRQQAQRNIEELGESAIPTIRRCVASRPSAEARRRLQQILSQLEPRLMAASPTRLREIRAVQILESIAAPNARQVLKSWAAGDAEAALTRDAQAALQRLAKSPTTKR
jgi:RNA polymerase sigma factor (sigma-70 family)